MRRDENWYIPDTSSEHKELDVIITADKVRAAIKSLKRNKSAWLDNIINNFFIESCDMLIGYIVDIFNGVLECGIFFRQLWESLCLYKKGEVNDVNNFREITLLLYFKIV